MGWKRKLADIAIAPAVFAGAIPLRFVRSMGIGDFPLSKAALFKLGVFPVRNHFYEPLFDARSLRPRDEPRELPGIEFNRAGQLALLNAFELHPALKALAATAPDELTFGLDNNQFGAGDAELWFHMIRHFKPRRIIEIGSGHSTRMAALAIRTLSADEAVYECEHICIEPFRMPWLERLGPTIVRQKVEEVDPEIFQSLQENDILFIDSSHMIRPDGDVLFEYLQLLPTLNSGVVVHVHDIFSPRDYPDAWIRNEVLFWNEQYLLESFLTHNIAWEVLLAANLLKHEQFELLREKCPYLTEEREPGSFYMRRV